VHVHDGRFAKHAKFDHALYYQTARHTRVANTAPIESFEGDAVAWSATDKTYEGLVAAGQAMLRRQLRSRLPNEDTWIAA
jgi:hypothetical protein